VFSEFCPICGSNNKKLLLNLGLQPPANALSNTYEDAIKMDKFDLSLEICNDCLYVGLRKKMPPEVLFKHNTYITGISATTRGDMEKFYKSCLQKAAIPEGGKILDIASNDGTLLSFFKKDGYKVLGVEPSSDAFNRAIKNGVPTLNLFFNSDVCEDINRLHGKFDLITATNLITHVNDPVDFLTAAKSLLKESGSIALEFYYFESLISNIAFDQIYHEHVSYFNFSTFKKLLEKVELEAYHVEVVSSQGGSLRVFISLPGKYKADETVNRLISKEGTHENIKERYEKFSDSVHQRAREIEELLDLKYSEGNVIAGYGASAKATVLTNYLKLSGQIIKGIADLSDIKQGKYIPGTGIPVISPDKLTDLSPDVIVIFSWNIADEIINQLSTQIKKPFVAVIFMPVFTQTSVNKVT
jgi:SAM-dependent methyltransferase